MSSLVVINKDYRLKIQSVMLVFSTGFVNYSLSTLLSVSSPLPLPFVKSILYVLYTRIQCEREGGRKYGVIGGEGPQTENTPAAKSLRILILKRDIWNRKSFLIKMACELIQSFKKWRDSAVRFMLACTVVYINYNLLIMRGVRML